VRQAGTISPANVHFNVKAPLDALDDPSPPELPLIRFCGADGCKRVARSGGRHCRPCHAAAVRRWREVNRAPLAVRRRDAAAARDADVRARDIARAVLAMAIRRGKVARGGCGVCGSRDDVIATIADPAAPLAVQWICRADQRAAREARRVENASRVAAAARATWERERSDALAAIAELPPAIRAELHVAAARGPVGIRLGPDAPMYRMQLVRAYRLMIAKTAQGH
jgi:hypothetical protein